MLHVVGTEMTTNDLCKEQSFVPKTILGTKTSSLFHANRNPFPSPAEAGKFTSSSKSFSHKGELSERPFYAQSKKPCKKGGPIILGQIEFFVGCGCG